MTFFQRLEVSSMKNPSTSTDLRFAQNRVTHFMIQKRRDIPVVSLLLKQLRNVNGALFNVA